MSDKSIIQRALDFAFGKPEAHTPGIRENRKQRRAREAVQRSRKHRGVRRG